MTEILGRLASVGEQLGIASAASCDARRWFTDDADPRAQNIAVRTLAEAVCYWAIGSAHGLANVLVRMLVLSPQARVVVNSAYKKADGFAPFSESEDAWISFGSRVVSVAREAAAGVESEAVNLIVDAPGDLARDHRWIAGLGLRAESFHRWRPQSIDGGVAKRSSWSPGIAGQLSMEVGSGPTNVVPDHLALLRMADDALDSVVDTARVLDTNFARATVKLGVPIFKLS